MKYDDLNLKKIREIPIFDVCSKLGITLYGMGKITKRAKCWYHDDKHPSMRVNKKKNIYKCFVCGKGGDVIKLVQDYENITFPEACDWLVNEFNIVLIDSEPLSAERYSSTAPLNLWSLATIGTQEGGKSNSSKLNSKLNNSETNSVKFPSEAGSISVQSVQSVVPLSPDLVQRSLSLDSQFCKSAISAGYLTDSQLRHAAARYRLGCSKDGGVIFWQIDDQQRVRTGKIMYYQPDCHRDKERHPTWVHALMKDTLPPNFEMQPCLFGLHLINSHPDPLMGRGYLSERATGGAVKPPNIGGGLAGVDASFSSFLRAEEKDSSQEKFGLHLLTLEQPTAGNSSKLNSKLNNSETNSVKFPSEAGPQTSAFSPQTSAGRYSSTAQFDFPLRAVEQNLPSEAGPKIAIVESEKTAIILSEKFPDFIWLSCGGLQMFKPELLEPLLQHRIIIFPDTDPQGEAFRQWTQVALDAQRLYKFRYSLRVSPLLEQHATPEQKEAKIDLVDFLFK